MRTTLTPAQLAQRRLAGKARWYSFIKTQLTAHNGSLEATATAIRKQSLVSGMPFARRLTAKGLQRITNRLDFIIYSGVAKQLPLPVNPQPGAPPCKL